MDSLPSVSFYLLARTPEDAQRFINKLEPEAVAALQGVVFEVLIDPFLDDGDVVILRKTRQPLNSITYNRLYRGDWN